MVQSVNDCTNKRIIKNLPTRRFFIILFVILFSEICFFYRGILHKLLRISLESYRTGLEDICSMSDRKCFFCILLDKEHRSSHLVYLLDYVEYLTDIKRGKSH